MTYWTKQQLVDWCTALERGEVTAAPAEGVYGYCADPFHPQAVAHINTLKKRDPSKGFLLLLPNAAWIPKVAPNFPEISASFPENSLQLLEENTPTPEGNPITFVIPLKNQGLHYLTGGKDSIALRIPACNYMQEYLSEWGKPLVSTSLNITGEAPVVDGKDIVEGIHKLILKDPLKGKSSKIYDLLTGEWVRK